MRVEGFGLAPGANYVCSGLSLVMASGNVHTFQANHAPWKSATRTFRFEVAEAGAAGGEGDQLLDLTFAGGTCTGAQLGYVSGQVAVPAAEAPVPPVPPADADEAGAAAIAVPAVAVAVAVAAAGGQAVINNPVSNGGDDDSSSRDSDEDK